MIPADRIVIHDHAPPGDLFEPWAFDRNIGKTIRLILQDGTVTHATVLAAKVVEDGRAVNITLEVAPWN